MLRFIVRRLLLLIPILLGLSILVFGWIRILPGSPAQALLGERATPETIAEIRHQLKLDRPLYEQYWGYLQTVGHFDFGISISSRRTVTYEFLHRFPATIELAVAAMLFATLIGIPLGFFAAKRYGSVFDHASLIGSLIGISIPLFFLGLILKGVFAVKLGWLPSIGRESVLSDAAPTNFFILDALIERDWAQLWDVLRHLVLRRSRSARFRSPSSRGSRERLCSTSRTRTTFAPHARRAAAADRRLASRAPKCAATGLDDHRAPDRAAPLGRRADRDDLRVAGDRQLAGGRDLQP
jgi:hypothetical protein